MNRLHSTSYLLACSSSLKWTIIAIAMLLLLSGDCFSQKKNEYPTYFSPTVQSFLPGTLVNWSVKVENEKVFLSWTTTIEENSVQFRIEKSINGEPYTDAGVLSAAGNSNIRKNYAFTEKLNNNTNKLIYYRLKMVDLDSNIRFSDVRTIRGNEPDGAMLQLYPNPTVNEVKVNITSSWINQNLQIQVFNINGLMVRSKATEKGRETATIDVRDLAKGMYVVKLCNGNESRLQKFLKN